MNTASLNSYFLNFTYIYYIMHYTSPAVYKHISQQTNDPIVERKVCRISWTKFAIYQSDLDFYRKISPSFVGTIFQIPTPTLCPEERKRRKLLFRNERKLYKRKCDATGETIISIYSPDKIYKVYQQNVWRSDDRDPLMYGMSYDTNTTFTEQFAALQRDVPRLCLTNRNAHNSEYCHQTDWAKDSYLVFGSKNVEDSWYSYRVVDSDHVFDSSFANQSSTIYDCVDVDESHDLLYSQSCKNCVTSILMHNCENCTHCFWCTNLFGKKYHIFNIEYTKDMYFRKATKLISTYSLGELQDMLPIKKVSSLNVFGSEQTLWHEIYNSKNIVHSHTIYDSENIRYSDDLYNWFSDTYDCYSWYWPCTRSYESFSFGVWWNSNLFVMNCRPTNNNIYTDNCYNCSNCFACIGLRDKQYCIFNKQYTKEECEKTVAKIITHMQETWEWGEFFHPSLAPFGYNESNAIDHFPLSKDETISRWYTRQDNSYDSVIPQDVQTLTGDDIPSDPHMVDDSILKKILICETSDRPYRIIKQELDFYRKHNLPLPRKHPDVRHQHRLNQKPGRDLHLRTCDNTWEKILSVYPQDVEFEVYSEEAYRKNIYG